MFCRNCRKELADLAVICTRCGVHYPRVAGDRYCDHCGSQTHSDAKECLTCGMAVRRQSCRDKSRLVAGLLGLFLGCWGCHRFYLGYRAEGMARLALTLGTMGFALPITMGWGIIEGIQIMLGQMHDADGNILEK
ncbi:MAG: TM2 domain-containing protein [bacterium]